MLLLLMLCSGSGGNVELGGSGTSRNPILVNHEEGVSSRAYFDDDTQDTDEKDGDDIGSDHSLEYEISIVCFIIEYFFKKSVMEYEI
ncbi:unnamed protein product [Vicia faba]|uniref:Uncharacterized protein n=1 Tax=Vicia faba TaxID=3906 RepID=A0AAV1BAK0_VICFA|nr:unnamed protein product [Vicia faba]